MRGKELSVVKAPRRSPESPYGSYEHLVSDGSHIEAMEIGNTTQASGR